MGIFNEWKIKGILKKENEELRNKISELEEKIEMIECNNKIGPIHISLLNEIKKRNNELFVLKREFENIKEYSHRILGISMQEASELARVKFRYFDLINDNRITVMNLVGAQKSEEFAFAQFERLRDEIASLRLRLAKYEKKDKVTG